MENSLKEEIFERYFINCDKADTVCNELGISRKDFTKFCAEIDIERHDDIIEMRRIRQLFHNKKEEIKGTDLQNFNTFYRWYLKQYGLQKGCCYYCNTEEGVVAAFLDKRIQNIKRPNRGKHLEIERRDSILNKYSSENCVLACYFCNNDKSDIFTESEYLEYLKDRKTFLTIQL